MPTYKLTIEYEGTRYSGWQAQGNTPKTIQGRLMRVAEELFGEADIGGAGRTDAGVHAAAQVAHLRIHKAVDPILMTRKMNDLLPHDINILEAVRASDRFHARHDAISRVYLYQIATRRTAFAKTFVWWIKDRLDFLAMRKAAASIPGRHDFNAFTDQRLKEDESRIVVVDAFDIAQENDLILIRIVASHFLWKMVRKLVAYPTNRANPEHQAAPSNETTQTNIMNRTGEQLPNPRRAELDAAGITDPALRAGYAACRTLNAGHGRTYFLATRLLPPDRRPAIHALYGFARYADEIVDDLRDHRTPLDRAAELDILSGQLDAALDGKPAAHPVLAAVAHTARRYAIDRRHFTDFLASMQMDTHVAEYPTYADLAPYVYGSAAVIGLQVLPVLGTVVPQTQAQDPAAALGIAFQLTNFLRDVGEDLDRGRLYLPLDELAAFGVNRELLMWSRRTRRPDPRIRRALAHLVARTRAVYRRAAPGLPMLEPVSRACVGCAFTLYGGILDEIARASYHVLHRRVAVPDPRRAAVVLPGLARALAARTKTPSPGRGG